MPVFNDPSIENIVSYVGLRELLYTIRDKNLISEDYFGIMEFPQKLTAGKNLIKIKAHPRNLVANSDIHIEVLDSNGDPIYYEPLKYIQKDSARVIAIWIYKDTPPGPATIYLAGRALVNNETGRIVPYSRNVNSTEYINTPNVIWSRSLPVSPYEKNSTEIIHLGSPSIQIKEIIQPYLKPVNMENIRLTKSGSASTVTLSPITITGGGTGYTSNFGLSVNSGVAGSNNSTGQSTTYGQGANSPGTLDPPFGSPAGMFAQIVSADNLATFTGYSSLQGESRLTFTNFPLSESMEGGTVTIVEPQIDTDSYNSLISDGANIDPFSQAAYSAPMSLTGIHTLSGSYVFQIAEVESATKCRVQYLSGLKNSTDNAGNGEFRISVKADPSTTDGQGAIDSISATANFTSSHIEPFVTVITEASQSFAEVIVSNIEPATGDVYKMKTQYKPGGMFGEYIDLGDTVLEKTQLLIDQEAFEAVASTGVDYNRIGFFTSLIDFNNYWTTTDFPIADENVATATFEPDVLMSGIKLTPATDFDTTTARYSGMHLKSDYKVSLTKDTKYIFDLKAYVTDNTISTDTTFPVPRLDIYVSGSINGVIPGMELNQWRANPFNAQQYPQGDDFEEFNGKFGTRISTFELDPSGSLASNVQATFRANDTFDADIFFVVRRGDWSVARVNLWTHQETGYSPNYVRQNIRIPTAFLKTPLAFKFNFYDYTGTPAEAEAIAYPVTFTGENTYIDGAGNLITGSVFVGNVVGSGVEIAGQSSAYIRSVGYEGFTSASRTDKPGGFMIFSGSVLPNSPDDYKGVGLELLNDSSSYFRFRTNPASIDMHTDTFFLGGDSAYVCGSNGNIEITSSNFHLDENGDVIMQGTIFATAGEIGGASIGSASLAYSPYWQISASSDETSPVSFISSSRFKVSAGGNITGSQVSFTGGNIASWKISGDTLKSTNFDTSTGIKLDGATTPEIHVKKSATNYVKMKYTGTNDWGIEGYNDSNALFQLGSTNQIGGWIFDDTTLTGGNLVLKKEGTIRTSDYISNVQGWTLNAASGGFLEVENARIRGTLSTAVFEKETVNAVGGQLYIANSTTLTGSTENPYGHYSATDTTMSVANVSGFTGSYGGHGEILAAKKVHSTGFATEYMFVHSSSRNNPSSDIDLSGKLYVTRGYVNAAHTSSLGDLVSAAQTYTGSQVIVSTGIVGTGYIRLNANPSDTTTPYMDIVERTGSGVFDMSHKARLGDLSGVSDTINGQAVSGYGLYTDNAFLKGGIVATYGSIGAINVGPTSMSVGTGQFTSSTTPFYVDSSGNFSLKDKLSWTAATNTLNIQGEVSLTAGSTMPDGNPITSAKSLSISSNPFVITFASASSTSASNGTDLIELTVTQQNIATSCSRDDITFTTADGSSLASTNVWTHLADAYPTASWSPTGSSGQSSGSFRFSNHLSADKDKLPLQATITLGGLSDTVTIYGLDGGPAGNDGTSGTPGTAGAPAKLITLESPTLAFVKALDGTITPATASLTASLQNMSPATASWTTTPSVTLLTGSLLDLTKMQVTKDNFGSNTSVRVIAASGSLTDDNYQQDSVTLVLLDEGAGNVQSVLSNPAHTIPADFGGGNPVFTGAGTTIKCYEGATELTFETTAGDVSAGEYSASIDKTSGGIVPGAFTGDGTATAVLAEPTAMTSDYGQIRMTITGSTQNDTDFEFPVTQSFAKSTAGEDGTSGAPGTAGAPAKLITLEAPTITFVKTLSGTITPATASLTASLQNMSPATASWTTTPEVTLNTGSLLDLTRMYITKDDFGSNTSVRVIAASGSSTDDNYQQDSTTIVLLDEGAGNVQSVLSNPSHTVPAAYGGGSEVFTGAGTTIQVFEGATALNYEETKLPFTATGVWSASISPVNVTFGDITGDGLTIATLADPTAMAQSNGALHIAITGSTQNGTPFFLPTTQSLAKSTAGEAGSPGTAGATAKLITLEAPTITFVKALDGTITPATASLSASLQNMSPATASWTTAPVITVSSGSLLDLTRMHITKDDFGSNTSVRVTVASGSSTDDNYQQDSVTLVLLDEGSGNVQTILSNPSHTYQAAYNAYPTVYAGGETTIRVFEGSTELTGSQGWSPLGNGEYSASINDVNITKGSTGELTTNPTFTGFAGGTPGQTVTGWTLQDTYDDATWTSITDGVKVITDATPPNVWRVRLYQLLHNTIEIGKTYRWSFEARAGGGSSQLLTKIMTGTSQAVQAGFSGGSYFNDTTFTKYEETFTCDAVNHLTSNVGFYFWMNDATTGNWMEIRNVSLIEYRPHLKLGTPSGMTETSASLNIEIKGLTQNGTPFEQSVTQSFVASQAGQDGAPAVSAMLSKPNHIYTGDIDGVVANFAGGGTAIQVYEGGSLLTYDNDITPAAGEYSASILEFKSVGGSDFSGTGTTLCFLSPPTTFGQYSTSGSIHIAITGSTAAGQEFFLPATQSFSKTIPGAQGDPGGIGATGNDYSYITGSLNEISYPRDAGLLLTSGALGFHEAIPSVLNQPIINYFSSYLDDSGNFYLAGSGSSAALGWNAAAGTLIISGAISASSGYIGNGSAGFAINSTFLGNGKSALADANPGVYVGTDGISLGASSVFKVSSEGVLNATAGNIGGFGISSTAISSSNDDLILTSTGQISASSAIFDDFIQVSAIRFKSIVITGGQNGNKDDYFVDNGDNTSTLYLDGSVNGGSSNGIPGTYPERVASHVELNLHCNGTHVNKIRKIVPASFNDRGFAEVQIVVGQTDVKIFADQNSAFAQQFGQAIAGQ